MTGWSISAMLLVGVAAGPHGLNVLSPAVLSFFEPGTAMALAMLGVFVGLSFDPHGRITPRAIAASVLRISIVTPPVGFAVFAVMAYLEVATNPWWVLPVVLGACAAVSEMATDANTDDVLMIVAAAIIIGVLREPEAVSVVRMMAALAAIAAMVAVAGWLLVGQTNLEAEQHVFVVGSLLLAGGAAAYLGLSALLAGLVAGTAWNLAGNVGRARITRDLYYFQHPLVVLVLVAAGAYSTVSIDAVALAAVFIAVRAIARPVGGALSRLLTPGDTPRESLIAAGLVGLAIGMDVFRVAEDTELAGMILGAVVVATIGTGVFGMISRSTAIVPSGPAGMPARSSDI